MIVRVVAQLLMLEQPKCTHTMLMEKKTGSLIPQNLSSYTDLLIRCDDQECVKKNGKKK